MKVFSHSRWLLIFMTVVLAFALPMPSTATAAAALPMTVTNKSGSASPVHLYVVGVQLSTGRLGYADSSGRFHPWKLPRAGGPVAAPDVSIAGPRNGAKKRVALPRGMSGRIYFSFAKRLSFRLVPGGLVQPAPWNPSDPSHQIRFDWSEFTLDGGGLWLNSSQVDQFAAPHTVSVTSTAAKTTSAGAVKPGGFAAVVRAIKADKAFARTVVTGADGQVLRVLAPGKAVAAGLFQADYLKPAIDKAWSTYRGRALTVVPAANGPRFHGRTQGNQLVFRNAAGRVVASFAKPSSTDVWNCDGALFAPNDRVRGPIARTLCAALHRGTLATVHTQPSSAKGYYQTSPANLYSRAIHAQMRDGKAYGFAFDDVQNQESLVHAAKPRSAGIVLG